MKIVKLSGLIILLLFGCASTTRKPLQEELIVKQNGESGAPIVSMDYDPASNLIYYIESPIGIPPVLYKFDLASKQRTEIMQLGKTAAPETKFWVNFSQTGSVLVYDYGSIDTFSGEVKQAPAIYELANDQVIRTIPVVDRTQLGRLPAERASACTQLLDTDSGATPLGYDDTNAGLPSMRQKPINLAPRFILTEKDGATLALDINLCTPEVFANYVSDVTNGNIATFNSAVLDQPKGKEWLRIDAQNLTFTANKTSILGNFACEDYEGELVWGEYALKSERCIHGILHFPTSMNIFLGDNALIYVRAEGIYKAVRP